MLLHQTPELFGRIDQGIRVLLVGGCDPAPSHTAALQQLEGYVRRRMARDQPLFAPFTAGVF